MFPLDDLSKTCLKTGYPSSIHWLVIISPVKLQFGDVARFQTHPNQVFIIIFCCSFGICALMAYGLYKFTMNEKSKSRISSMQPQPVEDMAAAVWVADAEYGQMLTDGYPLVI
jgi:hypothetical protein